MTRFRSFGDPPPTARNVNIGSGHWHVPEETPVAFVYNRRNYAVMLSTPADLEDFAIGFSITERVVNQPSDVKSVEIHHSDRGVELHLSIDAEKLERLDIRQQRRNLVGRAGCGVCGLENAETFFQVLPKVAKVPSSIDGRALQAALDSLPRFQSLNAETRAVHGAAWANLTGDIQLVREDIGRHNALDKLLGALARQDADLQQGFVMMSSRCSYEIVEKAARLGVRTVASISAPTAFAIRKAHEANMSLYARDGKGFVRVSSMVGS